MNFFKCKIPCIDSFVNEKKRSSFIKGPMRKNLRSKKKLFQIYSENFPWGDPVSSLDHLISGTCR